MGHIKIGRFVAAHGLKGEVVLVHELGKRATFKGVEALFVEKSKGDLLPYFIESAITKNETESYIKLDGIGSKEAARIVIPRDVWVDEKDFGALAAKAARIALLGYMLYDGDKPIGEITAVADMPQQVLCTVDHNGVEALVPVHPDNTLKIDKKNRKIHVEIPEGLLELYTG